MKKEEGKKKRKPPSREKYEKDNPTVSGRIPKETRSKLLLNLKELGMSLPDALKVLAGEVEVKVKPIDEARQQGYEEAKNRYMVTYPCNVCGKLISITSPEAKETVSRYMTDCGWGHVECHKKRRQL
jgi:hypothetical protein